MVRSVSADPLRHAARASPAAVSAMGTGQSKVNDDLVLLEDDGAVNCVSLRVADFSSISGADLFVSY